MRHVPGMSLNANQEPLNQIGVFTDGDNISVMTEYPADLNRLGYLDQITSALPYHLKKLNHILIVGAGGGADVLQAKFHQIPNISAIEINPQIVDLVNESYGDFTGHLYRRDDVTIHISEARDYLVKSSESYDLIQLALFDAFNGSISGLYSLNESYLYTTEALRIYLQRLNPDGYVSLTRWIKLPPRDTLKLFATATTVLRQMGVTSPEKSLILIRSWQTSTLLIKNGMFTNEELAAIETFCHERSFDLAYTPLLRPDQANRYNVLSSPLFFQATSAILSENAESFLDRYKFNIRPATDDKPFFHHFFNWSAFTEIYQLRRQGGMPLIEWGYINLIVTLLVASLFSIALIVLPMWYFHRRMLVTSDEIKGIKVVSYFFTIGLAFLFIEIAFIQKFTQLLHHPIYSIAVTLTAFLIFSGLGSLLTAKLLRYFTSEQIIISVATGIS
ncbi:MAG: SAM-dependent methyltransferase, partial [Desulfobulbia bacterium]